MATEPQRHALAKWLGQEVKNMNFEAASELLQRLHGASELYNTDPKKHKGIVKKEKETILSVLRNKGLLYEEGEQEEEEEQELKDFGDHIKEGMEGHISDFTERVGKQEQHNEADIVASTMREAVRAAVDITLKEVVEKDVPVQGLGGFVLEIGKVIFDAKMAEVVKQNDIHTAPRRGL